MKRATLMLMLSVSWPLLAIAADPAPAQADPEPKPLQSTQIQTMQIQTTQTQTIPDTRPLRGPEDFILPDPELRPHAGKDTGAQERVPSPQLPGNASVLDGF
jgi:hypothetical protein